MNKTSLKTQFVMNAITTFTAVLFPFLTFTYVSRILLPAGTGRVSFAVSIVSYFLIFCQLGIPTYGIRACARVRDDNDLLAKTVQELLGINLITCAISCAALAVSVFAVPRFAQDKPLFFITGITLLLSAIGVEWFYRAMEDYGYLALTSVLFRLVGLIATFLFIHAEEDYLIYAVISVFSNSGASIIHFFRLPRLVPLKPAGRLQLKPHLKAVALFFAMSCATTVYTHLDVSMLGFMKEDADVGYYNVAVTIKNLLVSVVTSLGAVLLPRASYYIEKGEHEAFQTMSAKALRFVFWIALPLMVYFLLFADEGILFLSGSAYMPSVTPMRVIMPTLLFIGITNILGIQMLVPMGRERVVFYSVLAGALVDVVINAILIPPLAATGAAIGTLVAELVVLFIQTVALRALAVSAFRSVPYRKYMDALLLACLLCLPVKYFANNLGTFPTLVISAVLFFIIYGVSLLGMKEEITSEVLETVKGYLKGTSGDRA